METQHTVMVPVSAVVPPQTSVTVLPAQTVAIGPHTVVVVPNDQSLLKGLAWSWSHSLFRDAAKVSASCAVIFGAMSLLHPAFLIVAVPCTAVAIGSTSAALHSYRNKLYHFGPTPTTVIINQAG